ncbi:MAG: two-component system response regulator [Gammaproteobacteria bacterium]|nr:MAG: two-component system response regulator [Gammaproteobacteria bacterium]
MEGKHVLIVDDVAENIQVAMNILQEDNYDFSFANSGEKAISILQESSINFDLILLDIMMPRMDGYEVCEYLKASPQWQDIPVIFLTARTDAESISRGFEAGGVDYILKPFHPTELLARVRNHIELYYAKKILKQQNIDLEVKSHHAKRRFLSELENNQKEIIHVLISLMEAASEETGQHIQRVAEISSLLAQYHPSLNEEDADILYHASPMHDIGKMTLPQEIIYKPGRYTEEEFKLMKSHAHNGYKLLCHSGRKFTKAAAIIAYEHHEKWDGSGYPRGLKGEDIHIYGRIVALADVFDALTHKRCYKEAWDMEEVLAYIKNHRETQFDPKLIDIFFNHLAEFESISRIS